jgi:hypothetical protein
MRVRMLMLMWEEAEPAQLQAKAGAKGTMSASLLRGRGRRVCGPKLSPRANRQRFCRRFQRRRTDKRVCRSSGRAGYRRH